jgi:hypothetical protein
MSPNEIIPRADSEGIPHRTRATDPITGGPLMPSRPRQLDADTQRLDLLAATQLIADAEVAHCWGLVREGIQSRRLGLGNLDRLVEALRLGDGISVDELTIEAEPFGSDHCVVAMLDDRRTCSVANLVQELTRLRERSGGEPGGPSGASAGGTSGAASEFSVASDGESSRPGDGERSAGEPSDLDLLQVLAGLCGTTPAKLAGVPQRYRDHVERVRASAAALAAAIRDPAASDAGRAECAAHLRQLLAESATGGGAAAGQRVGDLPSTLDTLGINLDHFAAPLRTIAQWLEDRTPAAGAAVDRLVEALDRAAEPLLGATRAHREAQRDQRIRESARAAISARLGRLGGDDGRD